MIACSTGIYAIIEYIAVGGARVLTAPVPGHGILVTFGIIVNKAAFRRAKVSLPTLHAIQSTSTIFHEIITVLNNDIDIVKDAGLRHLLV